MAFYQPVCLGASRRDRSGTDSQCSLDGSREQVPELATIVSPAYSWEFVVRIELEHQLLDLDGSGFTEIQSPCPSLPAGEIEREKHRPLRLIMRGHCFEVPADYITGV